jgi:hypothetical protein
MIYRQSDSSILYVPIVDAWLTVLFPYVLMYIEFRLQICESPHRGRPVVIVRAQPSKRRDVMLLTRNGPVAVDSMHLNLLKLIRPPYKLTK